MPTLTRLLTALACSSTALAAQCYFPNGDKVNSDTACNPNALVSACCYDNQACLSNGLCVSDPHDPVKARLHRGTCTDANWKSGNCPRQCLDIDNNGVPVYSCNSTSIDSYCCYDGCDCRANSGSEIFSFAQSPADVYTVTIIGESFTQTHTSSSSSTSTTSSSLATSSAPASTAAASTASTASTAATSAVAIDAEPAKKSNTTALGVGLGVGIPVAALIGVAIFFLMRRRRNRAAHAPPSEMAAIDNSLDPTLPSTKYAHTAEAEVFSANVHTTPTVPADATAPAPDMFELSGEGPKPAELPVSSVSSVAGERAVEMESPLHSPGPTGTRGA